MKILSKKAATMQGLEVLLMSRADVSSLRLEWNGPWLAFWWLRNEECGDTGREQTDEPSDGNYDTQISWVIRRSPRLKRCITT